MKKRITFRSVLSVAILTAGAMGLQAENTSVSLRLADELERAIYLHEGEVELAEAANVLEAILDETSLVDSLAAEAKYRLALVYLDQGKKALGMKVLNDLVELYPQESKWVAEAKEVLPKDFVPEITPWEDGERSHYDWILPSGDVIGTSFSTIYSYDWDGRSLWRKESRFVLNGHRATAVEYDKETFDTAYSLMVLGETGSTRAWYAEDGLSAKVEYSKSGAERTFDFNQRVYDNEQAVDLLRQIPLEVGYSMSKKIFVSFSGMPVDINFEVVGIEKMDTIFGNIDCYEVFIDMHVQQQSVFFTADERRILVKMSAGGVDGVLSKLETVDVNSEVAYRNDVHNYEITIPGSWGTVPQRKGNSDANQVIWLAEPLVRGKFLTISELNSGWNEETELNLENLINKVGQKVAKHFRSFSLDPDWGRPVNIDGMDGKLVRYTPPEGSESLDTVYLFVLLGEEKYHVFQGVIGKSEQEEMFPIFEKVALSLNTNL